MSDQQHEPKPHSAAACSPVWENDIKVFVCCVHYGAYDHVMHAESFASFVKDAAPLIDAGKIHIHRDRTQPLDYRRSWLAWTAAHPNNGFPHMFMYDTDMEVRLDHLTKLLSRNVACVSGTYFMGAHKLAVQPDGSQQPEQAFPCVASKDGAYIPRTAIRSAQREDRLIEIDSAGAGCLLVATEALRAIGQPAFKMNWQLGPSHAEIELEDGWFSRTARKAGLPLYMDPCVVPDHFKTVRIGMEIKDLNNYAFASPEE